MSPDFCYNPPHPKLTIEIVSTERAFIGETQTNFKITSEHALSRMQLHQMWDAGLFGRGQGFGIPGPKSESQRGKTLRVVKTQLDLGEHRDESPEWLYYVYEVFVRSSSDDLHSVLSRNLDL